VFSVNDEELSI